MHTNTRLFTLTYFTKLKTITPNIRKKPLRKKSLTAITPIKTQVSLLNIRINIQNGKF